jgi:peptidoglycan/LPS O-acetylase OafA/YrhL
MLYLGSGMILMAAVAHEWKPTRLITFVARMGSYSYSIYLWHAVVLIWGVPIIERTIGVSFNPWIDIALYMVASVALGVLMGRMIELPCLRLRDRVSFPLRWPALGARMTRA